MKTKKSSFKGLTRDDFDVAKVLTLLKKAKLPFNIAWQLEEACHRILALENALGNARFIAAKASHDILQLVPLRPKP